jgi:hypothetical protein
MLLSPHQPSVSPASSVRRRSRGPVETSRVAPFVSVDKTPHGPKLIVGRIYVDWWTSKEFEADAEGMASEINAMFFALRG